MKPFLPSPKLQLSSKLDPSVIEEVNSSCFHEAAGKLPWGVGGKPTPTCGHCQTCVICYNTLTWQEVSSELKLRLTKRPSKYI